MERECHNPIRVRIDESNSTDIGMLVASMADLEKPSASPYLVIEQGIAKPCCVVYAQRDRRSTVLCPHLHVRQEDIDVFSISLAE